MDNSLSSSPNLYALLIGIDRYLPNQLSDGSVYTNLQGAVRDINRVEAFLKRRSKVPINIIKLTSSSTKTSTISNDPKQLEPEKKLPTYKNIIAKFQEITTIAKAGDIVYIHYSGHGGRAITNYPEVKGELGIDEALVPMDIGTSEGNYLRDLELAYLINDMVERGLIVSIVLDSCVSGGLTRGGDAHIRAARNSIIDQTPRKVENLVAYPNQLVSNWLKLTDKGSRKKYSTIIPEIKGSVLLVACHPFEYAYEYAFDGKEENGALTYWFLDTLEQPFPGITYKMIHTRIKKKINILFPKQNPMILGESDLPFLDQAYKLDPFTMPAFVIEVKSDENKIKLNVGQAQGLYKGAEFVIYSLGTIDFTDKSPQRIALAKISKCDAATSWAEITEVINSQIPIEPGSQAIAVLTPVPVKLLKKVRLLNDKDTPLGREEALQLIEVAIQDNGWVKLVAENADNPEAADYQVDVKAVNESEAKTYRLTVGEVIYEICDRTGAPIILRPAVKVGDADAAEKIVKRLIHLAKYQATEELDNYNFESELEGKIAVEILGKQADYKRGDPIEPEPFEDPDNPTLDVGEYLFIKIRNNYSEVLNFTILDLESNWAISQIEPSRATSQYTPLDPGEDKLIVLKMSLPVGDKKGSDIFKVFATKDAVNFRQLTLPSLDKPFFSQAERGIITRSAYALNSLQQLLFSFADDRNPTRTGNPVAFLSNDWTTTQVKIQIIDPSFPQEEHKRIETLIPYAKGPVLVEEIFETAHLSFEPELKAKTLRRYPYIECPSSSLINERFTLHVQLLIKSPAPEIKAMEIEDTGIPEKLPEVEIVLRARGFDIEGTNTKVISIKRDDDTEERFVLIPRQLGEQQIRVDFYQNGKRIGTARRNIIIYAEEDSRTIEISQPQEQITLEFKNQLVVPPPDLELCVELDRHDQKTLYFTLHSTKSAIDYHHITLSAHSDWVTSIVFTSSDQLVSGSKDQTIKIWKIYRI